MSDEVASRIQRHLRSGVLVDTNLLLVYFIGLYDRISGYQAINSFRYTKGKYSTGDFNLLFTLLERFNSQVVTPHILTEVSNMLGHLSDPARETCFELLKRTIPSLHEHSVSSERLSEDEAFTKFGITDTSILEAAEPYLVLTDDHRLAGYLDKIGIDALNFQHIKLLS